MQFPFRDLTNQYISLSYQDVVQRYTQTTASYFLDGLGNVIGFIPLTSLGQQILTADQPSPPSVSASYALTASYALNGGSGGPSVSSSWASHSYSSEISTFVLASTFADTASLAFESTFADTASLAVYSDYAGSSSYAFSASISDTAEVANTASYVGGYNIDGAVAYADDAEFASTADTASFAWNSAAASIADSASYYPPFPNTVPTASYVATASYADSSLSASWAPMPTVSNSSSWASSSISASYSVTASTLTGFNFINTGSWISILNTDTPIVQIATGSYDAAFFDYVALSGSNTRAGMVFGSWVDGQINYTEVSNVDIGDTSKVTMSLALDGNVIQLIANVTDTTPWKIKALARYL